MTSWSKSFWMDFYYSHSRLFNIARSLPDTTDINYKISYYTQTWSTVDQTNGYANARTDAEIIFSPINDKTITLKGQGVCYDDGNYLVSFGNLTDHEELLFTINSDFDETFKISKNKEYCLWISAGSGPAHGYSGLSLEVIVPLPPTVIFFSSIIPIIMWFGRHKIIIFRKNFYKLINVFFVYITKISATHSEAAEEPNLNFHYFFEKARCSPRHQYLYPILQSRRPCRWPTEWLCGRIDPY